MKTKGIALLFLGLFLIAGMVSFLSSCDPDHLDLVPTYETEAMKFNQEGDFQKAIFGTYQVLTNLHWFNANSPMQTVYCLPGDDVTTLGSSPFENFSGLNPTLQILNEGAPPASGYGLFQMYYWMINRANVVIQKIEEEDGTVITTPDLKRNILGEAKFLRAWAHFKVWNYWGPNAPLVLRRIEGIDGVNTPSSSRIGPTTMIDSIVSNLEQAAELLPESWDAKYLGRVTKDAAYGLLGKALVYRGDYHNQVADYTAAIAAFNNISEHTLTTTFQENFSALSENNSESLFEVQAQKSTTGFENVWLDTDYSIGDGSMAAYWGQFIPYSCNWILPETGATISSANWAFWTAPGGFALVPTLKLYNAFDPADPRRAETCQPYLGTAPTSYNGYSFSKYNLRGIEGNFTTNLNNPRLLRLADCILLKAEAIVKSGGSLADAVDLINQIRERARNSITPASTEPADLGAAADDAEALQWIREERFLELAMEDGNRWFDLKRWDAHEDIDLSTWTYDDNGFSAAVTSGFDFSNFHTLTQGTLHFPIPIGESETNPNIDQNPGYGL